MSNRRSIIEQLEYLSRYLWPTIACISIALSIGALAVFSRYAAIDIPTYHLDGAFQTASGLFRLHAGERPGRDFYPYLGIGPLVVLYPAFVALGANMAASVTSAYFVVGVSQSLVIAWLVFLVYPCGRKGRALVALALGLCTVALIHAMANRVPYFLIERIVPGNSLRPLRALLPYLTSVVVYTTLNPARSSRVRFAVLGSLCGLSSLWSNDFGIPTAMAVIAVALYIAIREGGKLHLLMGIFLLGTGIGAIPLFLATAGHTDALIKYSFLDVAKDQWWYFGPWNEAFRIFGIRDSLRLFDSDTWLGLVCIGALVLSLRRQYSREVATILWLGATLFLGGAVASIGGHLGGYFSHFKFWAMVTIAAVLAREIVARFEMRRAGDAAILALCVALVVPSAYAWRFGYSIWSELNRYAATDPTRIFVPELGGYLPIAWESYVEVARTQPRGREIEEYWGVWSAIRRPKPLVPVDSVIHALGRTRLREVAVMEQKPDFVITTRPSVSAWQSWSLSANYWFYGVLLSDYSPILTSPMTVLWARTQSTPLEWRVAPCSPQRGGGFTVFAEQAGYYEVKMDYTPLPTGRHLVLLKTGDHETISGAAGISLELGSSSATLPVLARRAGDNHFGWEAIPNNTRVALEVTRCTARKIPDSDPRIFRHAGAANAP